jgi:hypothetical protein
MAPNPLPQAAGRTLTVARDVVIARPHRLVEDQFADVAHHAATGVHRGVRFEEVEGGPTRCTYDQVTRQGPVSLRQRFVLDRGDRARQVHTVVSGAFAGGTMTFDIRPVDDATTTVTATLEAPVGVLTGLAAPVLRAVLGRSLARALDEDRRDLESGAYRGSSAGT